MKIKSLLCLLIVVLNCAIVSAQKMSTADKFLSYLNKYQKKKLAAITTPDFKLKRKFSTKITGRKEFLSSYLEDSETLIAKFHVVKKPNGKSQNYYVVEDQSQYLKLLDVKFPKWKMTITTVAGKVSQVMLAPTEDYDNYITELNSKAEKFNSWMDENYPDIDFEKVTDISQILEYMNSYVESEGILISDLQEYDESTGQAELVTNTDALFENMTCVHRNKFNEAKRASFYPFNKAKKVVLISLNDKDWESEYFAETPRITDLSIAKTSKELSKSELAVLTDLFYNYGYKKEDLVKTISEKIDCPELKNAIVFVDENGKPFEYIALFFGCDEVEFSSQKVVYGDQCSTKNELLKQFFISNGIEIGQ